MANQQGKALKYYELKPKTQHEMWRPNPVPHNFLTRINSSN